MDLVTLQGPETAAAPIPGTFVVLRDLGNDVEGAFYPDAQPADALLGGELHGFKIKMPKRLLPKFKMPSFKVGGGGLNLKLPKFKVNLTPPKALREAGQSLFDSAASAYAAPIEAAAQVLQTGTGLFQSIVPMATGLVSNILPGMMPGAGGGQTQQQQQSQQPYQDPQTGLVWDGQRWTDPNTGMVYDDRSGQWLDPSTGQPQTQQQQSQLQYDQASGAYVDPSTGIYYDPNTGQPLNGDLGFLPALLAAAAPALLPVAGNIAEKFLPGAGGIVNQILPGLLPGQAPRAVAPPPVPRPPVMRPPVARAPVALPRSVPQQWGQDKSSNMMPLMLGGLGLLALVMLKK